MIKDFNIEQFLDLTNDSTETRVARRKTNKKTGVKHFDICLMNPPYGDVGNNTIHLKFVKECLNVCNSIVAIFPFMFTIQPTNNTTRKYKEACNGRLVEVEEVNSNVFKDTAMKNVGIYYFENTNNNNIKIKYLNKDEDNIEDFTKLTNFSTYEKNIIKYLDNNGVIDGCWAGGHDHFTLKSLKRKGITDENEAWKIIDNEIEKSCKNIKQNKVSLMLTETSFGANGKFIQGDAGEIFNNKNEVVEYMKKHGRKSSAGFIFMMFDTKHEAENCKIALQNPILRFTLYRTQHGRHIGLKHNYKYVPNIDWSNDNVKTDEGLLEICGCPKDKCKEYADYCKHIINELDKGNRL